MTSYELLFIVRPDLDEETTEAVITRVLTQIAGLGATVTSADRWGKRRLAYEIDDFREGVYAVVKLQAEPGATAELERNLRLAPEVMRYLVVKLET